AAALFIAQFGEVVGLAAVDDGDFPVRGVVLQRLRPTGQVDDGEPEVAERDVGTGVGAPGVGPAAGHGVAHGVDDGLLTGQIAPEIDPSGNDAHVATSSGLSPCWAVWEFLACIGQATNLRG